jgi:altronate dehydratase
MAIGKGKYDPEVTELRERLQAEGILLIVFGGPRGSDFGAQLPLEQMISTPEILEKLAKQIRADLGTIPRDA